MKQLVLILPLMIAFSIAGSRVMAAWPFGSADSAAPGQPNVCGGYVLLGGATGTFTDACIRTPMVCVANGMGHFAYAQQVIANGSVPLVGTSGDFVNVICAVADVAAAPTPTQTFTATPTFTPTKTPTATPTFTPTATATP